MKSYYAWAFHRRGRREPMNLVTYTGANGKRVTREEYFASFKPDAKPSAVTPQPLAPRAALPPERLAA